MSSYVPRVNTMTVMQDHPQTTVEGQKAEDLFPILFFEKAGMECIKATTDQQKKHIDYLCGRFTFDVKSRKRKNRHDAQFCDNEMLLEISNVFGFNGWLYGEATHIAQETADSFLIFNRQDLVYHYEANQHLYIKHSRHEDCFVWVPFDHLKTIKFSILPKPQTQPMSNYTPQPNTFSLFANDKGDNPKRPDYRGDIILPDGTKMRLSAWVKEGQSGKKFLSGKVEPMNESRPANAFEPQDGDMPF